MWQNLDKILGDSWYFFYQLYKKNPNCDVALGQRVSKNVSDFLDLGTPQKLRRRQPLTT